MDITCGGMRSPQVFLMQKPDRELRKWTKITIRFCKKTFVI